MGDGLRLGSERASRSTTATASDWVSCVGREAGFSAAQFAKAQTASVEMTEFGGGGKGNSNDKDKSKRKRQQQIPFGDDN